MPSKFTNHIREFIASSILSSIENSRSPEWAASTAYSLGDKVIANGNMYVCSAAGTSGVTSIPAHIIGVAMDNNVEWVYIERASTNNLFEGNLFMGIGKPGDWADPLTPDDINLVDSVETDTLNNLITLKNINSSNAKACVPRHDWVSGSVYDQYDSEKEMTEYTNPFYVVASNGVDDYMIFKCLDNAGGAQSTTMPSVALTSPFRTADKYVWQYMTSLNSSDVVRFMTDDFVPVSVAKSSSDGPEQWATQNAAQSNSISALKISGQTGTFATPVVDVIGDGTGANAACSKDLSNKIEQVYITDPGSGYSKSGTFAEVRNVLAATPSARATASVTLGTGLEFPGATGTWAAGNAAVSTLTPHGLITGNTVVLSGFPVKVFNGHKTVTVTSTTEFTFTMAADPGSTVSNVGNVTQQAGRITSFSVVGGTGYTDGAVAIVVADPVVAESLITNTSFLAGWLTVTTQGNHGLSSGDEVMITNATNGINGKHLVHVTTPTAFIIDVVDPGSASLIGNVKRVVTEATNPVVNVVAGSPTSVQTTTPGANMTNVRVFIISGNAGAICLPVMAPAGGHGRNVVRELAASTVMLSMKFTNTSSDTGYLLTDTGSEFHQISILTDPLEFSSGKYAYRNAYIGPMHPQYGGASLDRVKQGTGIVLYINNVKTVTRSTDQEEDVKVAITL